MSTTERPVQVLFICARNQIRSLTAENLFKGSSTYHARSAGVSPQARVKVTQGMIGWADVIFVMEKGHRERLRQKFSDSLAEKKLVCLNIRDEYTYGEQALIDVLSEKLNEHLTL